jgi:FKBP-type peptidyl-prolyl cis-trans isomerase/predicted small secreted protein
MKHIALIVLAVFLCALSFSGCGANGKTGAGSASGTETFDKDASYALGLNIGSGMKSDSLSPDLNEFMKGLKDGLSGGETRFTVEEAQAKIQNAFTALMEKRDEGQKQAEVDFLAENSKKSGVTVTASGLQYEVISEGSGAKPTAESTVRVHYEGTLSDGNTFDSSYSRGEPAEFPLNGVIAGWTEGIQLMSVGSKYRFFIPSELGYGSQGAGQRIPPYSPLIFEVELLDIVK